MMFLNFRNRCLYNNVNDMSNQEDSGSDLGNKYYDAFDATMYFVKEYYKNYTNDDETIESYRTELKLRSFEIEIYNSDYMYNFYEGTATIEITGVINIDGFEEPYSKKYTGHIENSTGTPLIIDTENTYITDAEYTYWYPNITITSVNITIRETRNNDLIRLYYSKNVEQDIYEDYV